ncbi:MULTISPECIES: SUKH-3 domain-containing protein [Streptomyces]|uniref:SUKH-3 domain-containing protein n=1 Tax=Streptomyces mutomycini TaxID=284036 RepID=A0ABW0BAA4_9ACTN|nr:MULTISPECIES: SUKH-3 domain-containing protein [Streptomyces]
MPILSTAEEVDAWLTEAGWHPGRDAGEEVVSKAIATVVARYRSYGVKIEPSEPAIAFIREHAFLRAVIDTAPENFAIFTPHLVFKGDAEEISELAANLGVPLFPVGYDSYDGATILMDRDGRFFFAHHTGAYYLGHEKYVAMMRLMSSEMEDAEDYFS